MNPPSRPATLKAAQTSALRTVALWALILYHALLLAACLTNLVANSFALKGGNFYSTQLVSSDLLARWIFWSPLFLPLWIRLLAQELSLQLPARLLLPGFAASLAMNFPFAAIDLSKGIPWLNLLQTGLRDGVVQPSAFLLLVGGIAALRPKASLPGTRGLLVFVAGSAAAAGVLKLILAGPALPRLEDETGYYLQSLIFQSGALKAAVTLPPEISMESIQNALSLAFVGQQGLQYYSLHLHGWPALLSVLGKAGLAPFANFILWALNILLFHRLLKLHLPEDTVWIRILSLALFCLSPLLLFLSNTYMAHTLALTLSLIIVHAHERSFFTLSGVLWASINLIAAFALVLVRPQALAPLAAALLLVNLLDLRHGINTPLVRSAALIAGSAAGYLAFRVYAQNFGADFPVNSAACNMPGFGPGHGCFPTYGTLGHTFTKTLFNTGDLLSRWNQELSPGGLPVALLCIWLWARQWRQALSRLTLLYSSVVLASIAQFGLFFHNGGESYHGRYLADSAFAMALLAGILLQGELKEGMESFIQRAGRAIVPAVLILVPCSVFLQIRGEYVHPDIEPFRSVSALVPVQNGIIVLSPAGSDVQVPDAFTGETILVPRALLRTYLNLGYGTLAATAVRIGQYGVPEDNSGNLLLGEMNQADALRLGGLLGRPVYVLKFNSFEPVTKRSRYARFWIRRPPSLERITNAD